MTTTMQILVGGTHGLDDDTFQKLSAAVKRVFAGTPLEQPDISPAHGEWGISEHGEFHGHITIDLIGEEAPLIWKQKAIELEHACKEALKGTFFAAANNFRIGMRVLRQRSPVHHKSRKEDLFPILPPAALTATR